MPISGPTSDHATIAQWAERNSFLPAEQMPSRVNGEPAQLHFVHATGARHREDIVLVPWHDFFAKFDVHGLAFVFDDAVGFYEFVQVEERSPYSSGVNRSN